jgi:hypothetical protein
MNIKNWDGRAWNVSGLELGQVEVCFEKDNEPLGFIKSETFWLCEETLASQEELCSMEFLSYF